MHMGTLFAMTVLLLPRSCTSNHRDFRFSPVHRQGRALCSSSSGNSSTWDGECSSCALGSTNRKTWRDSCAWLRWWCWLRRRSPCALRWILYFFENSLRWIYSLFSSQQLHAPAASGIPCRLPQRHPARACDCWRNGQLQRPDRCIRTFWIRLFPFQKHFAPFSASNTRARTTPLMPMQELLQRSVLLETMPYCVYLHLQIKSDKMDIYNFLFI